MSNALIVHRPEGQPNQLVLLLHGVGSRAEDLQPLGAGLARHFPRALIVSVRAPDASDLGAGWQWFSVRGVDEANRPLRVAAAMPRFVQMVKDWQQSSGMDAHATTLIGFSQGAIMALESTQVRAPLAACIVAVAGRFAAAPRVAALGARVHLLHGEDDQVMPVQLAQSAQSQLAALGTVATLDRFPGLGHGMDARVLARMAQRMSEG